MDVKGLLRTGIRVMVVICLLAAAWWAGRVFVSDETAVRAFLGDFPVGIAAGIFIALYVLSSFVIVDLKDLLKIAAALLYGPWWSTLFIWVAELINNGMLFHLSRRLGRSWLERKFHLQGKDVRWVERACGTWQIFILRIVPVVPYRLLDVAYGLTTVSFRRYFFVSALASPFRIFWLQFILAGLGGAVFEPEKVMLYLQAHPRVLQFAAAYLFLSLGATLFLNRKFRKS